MSGSNVVARTCSIIFLTIVLGFLLTPLLYVAFGSLNASTLEFPPRTLSIESYRTIPEAFFDGLRVSLIVAAAATVLATPLGVAAALGIVRGRFGGRELLNGFLLSPLLLPMLVLGVALYQFYVVIDRTADTAITGSLVGLILGHTSFCIPYVARAVIPALTQMPPSLEEAAHDLGASTWYAFSRVTLPAIRPGLAGGIAFAFLTSFDNFPMSLFLVEGDNTTLPVVMFQFIQFDLKPTILAMSTLVIIFSMAAMLFIEKTVGLASLVGLHED
jgi:putative spermidine/putrescine transport system permease protein